MLVGLLKPVWFDTTGTNHHTDIGVRPKATSMAQSSQVADNDDKGIMRELITVLTTVIERLPVPVNDQHDNGESKNTPYTGPQRKTVPTSDPKKISSGRRQDLRTQRERFHLTGLIITLSGAPITIGRPPGVISVTLVPASITQINRNLQAVTATPAIVGCGKCLLTSVS